jgi:hypothetical protein
MYYSRDSILELVSMAWIVSWENLVWFSTEAKDVFLLQSVMTESGAHTVYYLMGTANFSPGVRLNPEGDHLLPFNADV